MIAQVQHRIEGVPVIQDPEILSGEPVFEQTRVPVSALFDYLEDDYSLDEFLESFPSVSRSAAIQVLHYGQKRIAEALAA